MVGPDQPAEMSLHRSKEVLDDEGFFITQPDPEFNVRKLGTGSNFYPVRNNAPLLPPGQRPSGPAAAAGLHFRIIPEGSNAPLGFESQRLEFLTGFIDGGGSETFGRQGIEDPLQRDRLTGNAHGSDRRDTDRKEKESLDMAGSHPQNMKIQLSPLPLDACLQ
jgi:hypothetical protein